MQMKPAFAHARLKKGDAYRKHTQRVCDKVCTRDNNNISLTLYRTQVTIAAVMAAAKPRKENPVPPKKLSLQKAALKLRIHRQKGRTGP
jgi:hypothetical protein